MASTPTDLDLSQAQAFAMKPLELAELLGTVVHSLQSSQAVLGACTDVAGLHRALHDLKGYLGLVAGSDLCSAVRRADEAAREGQLDACRSVLDQIIPRLEALLIEVRTYRAGIIAG